MSGAKTQPTADGGQLVRREAPDQIPVQMAEHFARSGYFKDASDVSKAVVKIVAGRELGLGPMASMTGIHIIEGKPSLSANLLATQVKRHPAYDYIPREITDQAAKVEFFQNGESIGVSEFTLADAAKAGIAGKQNFKCYPKAMMFARALSQGVRWFCPDVTAGSPAYVPEELGAEVDAEGEPIEAKATEREPEPEPEPADAEVVEPLDPKRVNTLGKATGLLGLTYDQINLMLGAHGVDALRAASGKALRERLESLTEGQADALEAELGARADV